MSLFSSSVSKISRDRELVADQLGIDAGGKDGLAYSLLKLAIFQESWNTVLDDAIKESIDYGYTHHINRLMIISNLMNLSGVSPNKMYEWFMEMYIDSADWVMVPNVYGMGSYADGGIFSTKPYICGSSYMLRMSNYKKGEWCDVVDGLYWRFIEKNIGFFEKNPRLSLMTRALGRLDKERKNIIFDKSEEFITNNTN